MVVGEGKRPFFHYAMGFFLIRVRATTICIKSLYNLYKWKHMQRRIIFTLPRDVLRIDRWDLGRTELRDSKRIRSNPIGSEQVPRGLGELGFLR